MYLTLKLPSSNNFNVENVKENSPTLDELMVFYNKIKKVHVNEKSSCFKECTLELLENIRGYLMNLHVESFFDVKSFLDEEGDFLREDRKNRFII